MNSKVLDIPLPELQGLKTLKIAFRRATKDEVVIHTTRLPKQSTVGDVINDLKTKVELSHPNAELRLLEIFYHKIYKIFPLNEKIENINDQYLTLRAEEIPEEEKNLAPHDSLIHVYHFTKDTAQNQVPVQNFGEPFFLVIREGEILGEVKVRIQEKLQVPDEEFSKWKFAFLFLGRPEYLQDSDVVSRCFQRRNDYGAWSQYLGLEHSNNSPKRSYAANQSLEGEQMQRKETTEGPPKRTKAKITAPPKPIDLRAERKRIEREAKRRAKEMTKKSAEEVRGAEEGSARASSPPGANVEPHLEPTSSLGKRDSGQREPKMKAVSRLKQLEEIGRADELDAKRRKKPAEPWVVSFERSDGTPIMNNESLEEDHTLGEQLLAGVGLTRDLGLLEDPAEGWIDMCYHMSRAAQLGYRLNYAHDKARKAAERDRKNLEKALQAVAQGDAERKKLKIEIDSLKPFKVMSSSFHAENKQLKARVEELEREKEVLVEEGKAECERKVAEAEARGFERARPYYLHQVNEMEAESRASQHKVSYLQGFSHGLDATGVGPNDKRRAMIVLPEMPEVEDEEEDEDSSKGGEVGGSVAKGEMPSPTELEILDFAASDQDATVTTLTVG